MLETVFEVCFYILVLIGLASLFDTCRCLTRFHNWQKWQTEKTVDGHDLQHRRCLDCGREERHWVDADNDLAHKQGEV